MDMKRTQKLPSREEVAALIEACRRLLEEQFGARRVIPFGSVIGTGRWHPGSDLDLAVEGLPPERFFKALATVQELTPRGLRVDLVSLEDARPELRARILKEVAMPDDPIAALKQLIQDELEALKTGIREMEELLATRADPPTRTELRAIASMLHDFYTGVERIFERIAVQLQEGLSRGEHWHMDLLEQIAAEREGTRPAVIDKPLKVLLKEYLEFRHFFRHAYGAELKWVKLRPLTEGMSETFTQLEKQLETFFDYLLGEGKKEKSNELRI
jgi:predicted nucleotidyltransferase